MQNLPKLSHLRTVLQSLDKGSDLYNSQAEVCALVEQLENNSYTVYSRDFGNMSWKDECVALNVPLETMEVELALFVKEVKIDTSDMAKRFCLDNKLIRNYGDGRYYYDHPDNGVNDMLLAHIEGDKLVYDINPIFPIGETFTLPYEEEQEDGSFKVITETYAITEYDLSGCHSNGIVYLGDGGSAWILEDALIAQKAKFKVGNTFTTQFDYYEKGEVVTHTITSIDFSREEADEVVYWDNNLVYCTESELMKQKYGIFADDNEILYTPDHWEAEEHDGKEGVTGKYILDICDGDVQLANRVYALCEWQHPETIRDELKWDDTDLPEGMNVGQLIAELQKLDPDKLVTIVIGDEDSNIIDTSHFELHATDEGVEYLELFVNVSYENLAKFFPQK